MSRDFIPYEEMKAAEDAYALSLGRMVQQWGVLEQRFGFWFQYLTEMPAPRSNAIYFATKAFSARIDLLRGAARASSKDEAFVTFVKVAMNRALAASAMRNVIVHGDSAIDLSGEEVRLVLYDLKKHDGVFLNSDNMRSVESIDEFTAMLRELCRLIMDGLDAARRGIPLEIPEWPDTSTKG